MITSKMENIKWISVTSFASGIISPLTFSSPDLRKFLDVSNEDIKASKVLFEEKLFPQAVFYFQQSVEKSNKAISQGNPETSEYYLKRKIGHETLNIPVLLLNKINEGSKVFDEILKGLDIKGNSKIKKEWMPNLKRIETESKEFKRQRQDARKDDSIINQRLGPLIEYLKEFRKKFADMTDIHIVKKEMQEISKDVSSVIKKLCPEKYEELREGVEKIDIDYNKISKFLSDAIRFGIPAYFSSITLGFITEPHAISTRYPEGQTTPQDVYNAKNPLVRNLPELIEIQEKAISDIEKFNEVLDSLKNMPEIVLIKSVLREIND